MVLDTDCRFSGTPLWGEMPLEVTFTDESIHTPVSWQWSFGDGNTSTEQNPIYEYTFLGTFTVTLIATDAAGESDYETKSAYVTVVGTPPELSVGDNITTAELSCGQTTATRVRPPILEDKVVVVQTSSGQLVAIRLSYWYASGQGIDYLDLPEVHLRRDYWAPSKSFTLTHTPSVPLWIAWWAKPWTDDTIGSAVGRNGSIIPGTIHYNDIDDTYEHYAHTIDGWSEGDDVQILAKMNSRVQDGWVYNFRIKGNPVFKLWDINIGDEVVVLQPSLGLPAAYKQ